MRKKLQQEDILMYEERTCLAHKVKCDKRFVKRVPDRYVLHIQVFGLMRVGGMCGIVNNIYKNEI